MIFTENLLIKLIDELKSKGTTLADMSPVTVIIDRVSRYQNKNGAVSYSIPAIIKDENGISFRHNLSIHANGSTQKLWNLLESQYSTLGFTAQNQPAPINPAKVLCEGFMINLMSKIFDNNKQNDMASRRNVVLKGDWYVGALQMVADAEFQTNNPATATGYTSQTAPQQTAQQTTAPAANKAEWTPPATDLPY